MFVGIAVVGTAAASRGHFYSGLSSGRWPAWVLTTRRSASCAGADYRRRRTCPNIDTRLSQILLQMLRCWVWFITETFGTKLNQRLPSIRRKHDDIWKASSFCSSDFVRVQVSEIYSRRIWREHCIAAAWCTDLAHDTGSKTNVLEHLWFRVAAWANVTAEVREAFDDMDGVSALDGYSLRRRSMSSVLEMGLGPWRV